VTDSLAEQVFRSFVLHALFDILCNFCEVVGLHVLVIYIILHCFLHFIFDSLGVCAAMEFYDVVIFKWPKIIINHQ